MYNAGTDIKNHKVEQKKIHTQRNARRQTRTVQKKYINNKHVETIKAECVE